jgi:hypothetical protein
MMVSVHTEITSNEPCIIHILISLLHNNNDNLRRDFGIFVIQHFDHYIVTLVLISFPFIVLYYDVLVITITMCLGKKLYSLLHKHSLTICKFFKLSFHKVIIPDRT